MKSDVRKTPTSRVRKSLTAERDLAAVRQFRKALGRVIAEVRDGMGLSQYELAERLGVDQSTVGHAERGDNLWRLETWLEVSRVLKVPFHELFRRAAERDSRGADMNRRVEALDAEEVELVHLWRQLTAEGREILLGRAKACAELYHREDNVVPLVRAARGAKSRKSN